MIAKLTRIDQRIKAKYYFISERDFEDIRSAGQSNDCHS